MEKHFLKLLDFTPAEIQQFLDTAADLKVTEDEFPRMSWHRRYRESLDLAVGKFCPDIHRLRKITKTGS